MMQSTNVKFPKAPTVLPIMDIIRFSAGQDLASLKTRSWKYFITHKYVIILVCDVCDETVIWRERKVTYIDCAQLI